MTTPKRYERDLSPILSDLAMAPYPDYVDDVLERTGRMRQRSVWTFPGRWLPMDFTTRALPVPRLPWRQLGVLALVALLLAVALAAYVGSQRRVPAPFGPAANGLIPYASNGDIYLGNPITGETRVLVKSAVVAVAGTTLTDVFVVGIDGSSPRKITPQAIDRLIWGGWTPDGRRLALIHDVDPKAGQCPTTICNVGQLDLVVRRAGGGIGGAGNAVLFVLKSSVETT